MNAYAKLKNSANPNPFEVLLGILKKIEAKNAVLVGVHSFLITVIITVYLTLLAGSDQLEISNWLIVTLCLLFLPAATSLGGLRQVDSKHLNQSSLMPDHKQLKRALMEDADLKEMFFRFSVICTAIIFCFGISGVALLHFY